MKRGLTPYAERNVRKAQKQLAVVNVLESCSPFTCKLNLSASIRDPLSSKYYNNDDIYNFPDQRSF